MRRVPWYIWALGAVALLVFFARRTGALKGVVTGAGNQSANPNAMANTPAGLVGTVSDGLAKVIGSITGKG